MKDKFCVVVYSTSAGVIKGFKVRDGYYWPKTKDQAEGLIHEFTSDSWEECKVLAMPRVNLVGPEQEGVRNKYEILLAFDDIYRAYEMEDFLTHIFIQGFVAGRRAHRK